MQIMELVRQTAGRRGRKIQKLASLPRGNTGKMRGNANGFVKHKKLPRSRIAQQLKKILLLVVTFNRCVRLGRREAREFLLVQNLAISGIGKSRR